MDGVLVDTPRVARDATNQLLKSRGFSFTQKQFKPFLSVPAFERVGVWNKRYGWDLAPDIFYEQFVDAQLALVRDEIAKGEAKNKLEELKERGLKLGLATNARTVKANKLLAAMEMENFFDAVVTGDEVQTPKPNKEIYVKTMEKLVVQPSETIVVEDAAHGIRAAKRAGAKVLALKTAPFSRNELREADAVIDDLREVANYL